MGRVARVRPQARQSGRADAEQAGSRRFVTLRALQCKLHELAFDECRSVTQRRRQVGVGQINVIEPGSDLGDALGKRVVERAAGWGARHAGARHGIRCGES